MYALIQGIDTKEQLQMTCIPIFFESLKRLAGGRVFRIQGIDMRLLIDQMEPLSHLPDRFQHSSMIRAEDDIFAAPLRHVPVKEHIQPFRFIQSPL